MNGSKRTLAIYTFGVFRSRVERGDGYTPATLSLWTDLASLAAFSYAGLHADALRHRREWFDAPVWPTYVLWWVDARRVPSWQEAVVRHEHLHDVGASPFAFDFKSPFDADGEPVKVDKARVDALAANSA